MELPNAPHGFAEPFVPKISTPHCNMCEDFTETGSVAFHREISLARRSHDFFTPKSIDRLPLPDTVLAQSEAIVCRLGQHVGAYRAVNFLAVGAVSRSE